MATKGVTNEIPFGCDCNNGARPAVLRVVYRGPPDGVVATDLSSFTRGITSDIAVQYPCGDADAPMTGKSDARFVDCNEPCLRDGGNCEYDGVTSTIVTVQSGDTVCVVASSNDVSLFYRASLAAAGTVARTALSNVCRGAAKGRSAVPLDSCGAHGSPMVDIVALVGTTAAYLELTMYDCRHRRRKPPSTTTTMRTAAAALPNFSKRASGAALRAPFRSRHHPCAVRLRRRRRGHSSARDHPEAASGPRARRMSSGTRRATATPRPVSSRCGVPANVGPRSKHWPPRTTHWRTGSNLRRRKIRARWIEERASRSRGGRTFASRQCSPPPSCPRA